MANKIEKFPIDKIFQLCYTTVIIILSAAYSAKVTIGENRERGERVYAIPHATGTVNA